MLSTKKLAPNVKETKIRFVGSFMLAPLKWFMLETALGAEDIVGLNGPSSDGSNQ